jgi:hypothetical protein
VTAERPILMHERLACAYHSKQLAPFSDSPQKR